LVIVSLNIYRRKKLAWWSALALAGFSVVFHLTKGVDYEEASFSAVLLLLLLLARPHFTVRSRLAGWTGAMLRVVWRWCWPQLWDGRFWFLEPRSSHQFRLEDSCGAHRGSSRWQGTRR